MLFVYIVSLSVTDASVSPRRRSKLRESVVNGAKDCAVGVGSLVGATIVGGPVGTAMWLGVAGTVGGIAVSHALFNGGKEIVVAFTQNGKIELLEEPRMFGAHKKSKDRRGSSNLLAPAMGSEGSAEAVRRGNADLVKARAGLVLRKTLFWRKGSTYSKFKLDLANSMLTPTSCTPLMSTPEE